MTTNKEIKYNDKNNTTKKENEKNKRLQELIDRKIPYSEMTNEEIEMVIWYHANNIAERLYIERGTQEANEILKSESKSREKRINEAMDKHTEMCNKMIELSEAQKKKYDEFDSDIKLAETQRNRYEQSEE